MEHLRCAHCRNPIRGRQAQVTHARAGMTFHADCWATLHEHVQQDYVHRVDDDGLDSLLSPYSRTAMATWLPEEAIDTAAEELTDLLVEELVEEAGAPSTDAAATSAEAVVDPIDPEPAV